MAALAEAIALLEAAASDADTVAAMTARELLRYAASRPLEPPLPQPSASAASASAFGGEEVAVAPEAEDPEGSDGEHEPTHSAAAGMAAATQAFNILRPGGTCTVVGMHPLGSEISFPGPAFLQEKKILGY